MKTIDIRIKPSEIALLKQLLGATITSMEHAPFSFTNAVSQVVKVNAGDNSAFLYSFTEPIDYYGTTEDVAVLSFEKTVYPIVSEMTLISMPIMQPLQKVIIVQENQKLYDGDTQIYDVWLTRGLIFDFGEYQISFEKAVWFSEEIKIQKGYHLEHTFVSTNDFCNGDWAPNITAKCVREKSILQ